MQGLSFISNLSDGEASLLEAAGYLCARDLSRVDPEKLYAELVKANGMLELVDGNPSQEKVSTWVELAKGNENLISVGRGVAVETGESEAGESNWVNYEADPDVKDMISRSPVALPLPNRLLADRGIVPSDIPKAHLLNCASGDLDVRVSTSSSKTFSTSPEMTPKSKKSGVVNVAESRAGSRQGIDKKRVRALEDVRDGTDELNVKPLERPKPEEDERLHLLRTARQSTNEGVDPNSRRFVRGVLHDQPLFVWLGCVFVILFQLSIPLGLLSAPLLILSDHMPDLFSWVPAWIIAFPIAIPVTGFLYLIVSSRVKCRVCGQKVLVPRHCRKHVKAHHIHGLGYITPLALHTVLFRWFNCTLCGTAVRIKE